MDERYEMRKIDSGGVNIRWQASSEVLMRTRSILIFSSLMVINIGMEFDKDDSNNNTT